MSFYDAIRIGASGAGDYEVKRSIRGDDNQSSPHRLTRTVQSGGNLKKFTISFWVKRSQLGNTNYSNSSGNDGQSILHTVGQSNRGWLKFDSDDKLGFDQGYDSGGSGGRLTTTAKYRDTSAWYHFLVVADYANSTATDRAKVFVNGVRQEVTIDNAFTDADGKLNTNQQHEIGYAEYGQGYTGSSWWFNFFCGYFAEFYFIDGQALDPTSFTETNALTGQLVPKEYEGTFGTTGWYLAFTDNSGATATTLGKDYSGNGNNWTPNGFSVSAGAGNDSLEDTPTNNFCTLNPLAIFGDGIAEELSNGNLEAKHTSSSYRVTGSTFYLTTGKWYYEVKVIAEGSNFLVGVAGDDYAAGSGARRAYNKNGQKYGQDGFGNNYGASFTTNDIIGVAINLDDGELTFYKNGASQGVAFTDLLTGLVGSGWTPIFNGNSNSHAAFNFGQRAFDYTVPTGYKALNSKNLPTPSILLPNKYFDLALWTGDNTHNRDITGFNFKPDWVWIKARSHNAYGGNLYYHHLAWDSLRGVGSDTIGASSRKEITINENYTEGRGASYTDYYGHVSAFNSNGFEIDKYGGEPAIYVNLLSRTYVGWCWDAGETDSATYRVVVVSDSGNKYRFRNSANSATFAQSAVTLALAEGGTYTFDQSDSTMSSHPMKLSTTANGTHGGGTSYNTGVTYRIRWINCY